MGRGRRSKPPVGRSGPRSGPGAQTLIHAAHHGFRTDDDRARPRDGLIAFASDRSGDGNLDIWLRQVAGGEPARLTSSPADDLEPSFLPDGSRIAFRSDRDGGGVYVISTLGGDARRIADRQLGAQGRDRMTPYRFSDLEGGCAARVRRRGRGRRAAAPLRGLRGRVLADLVGRRDPGSSSWAEDGECRADDWWLADADGSSPERAYAAIRKRANPEGSFEGLRSPDVWNADGVSAFRAPGRQHERLVPVAVAPRRGRASVRRTRLTAGTGIEMGATIDGAGTLAFAAVTNDIDLWSLSLQSRTLRPHRAMQRLTHDPASDLSPWLSPDGRSLAFASNRSGTNDIWVRNLATGKRRVSRRGAYCSFPSLPTFGEGRKTGLRSATAESTDGGTGPVRELAARPSSAPPQVVR